MRKAKEFGLGPADVEKDYVHGRLLQALYSKSLLGAEL